MRAKTMVGLGIGLALGAGACGEPPDTDGSGSGREPAAYAQEGALTGLSNGTLWFRWSKGEPAKVLAPYATHVCGISMVRGELARDTYLAVYRSNGNWMMRGAHPGSNFLQMDAVCEALSAFTVNSGVVAENRGVHTALLTTTGAEDVEALPANTAPVMLGLNGSFRGRGETASVTVGANPTVRVRNGGAPGNHAAFANALYLGPKVPYYVHDGPVADRWVRWPVGSEGICLGGGCSTIAPLATSFCYLTAVSGEFNGADEWVQVFPNREGGAWTLDARAGESHFGGNGNVYAEAQCLETNQFHPPTPPIIR
jgi:hypothetical protein